MRLPEVSANGVANPPYISSPRWADPTTTRADFFVSSVVKILCEQLQARCSVKEQHKQRPRSKREGRKQFSLILRSFRARFMESTFFSMTSDDRRICKCTILAYLQVRRCYPL